MENVIAAKMILKIVTFGLSVVCLGKHFILRYKKGEK